MEGGFVSLEMFHSFIIKFVNLKHYLGTDLEARVYKRGLKKAVTLMMVLFIKTLSLFCLFLQPPEYQCPVTFVYVEAWFKNRVVTFFHLSTVQCLRGSQKSIRANQAE